MGCADPDGRRRGAARRRVSPERRRQISGDPELRALRQGPEHAGGLPARLAAHREGLSRHREGLVQQVPELGAARSRALGAGRLRAAARQLARRRPLARPPRSVVGARGEGHRARRRLGRHASLVERQGRHQRHLVLLDEPVAGGAAAAEAPRRAVLVGGLVRLLPRARPPRRHPVGLPVVLVSAPGHRRAARRRRIAGRRAWSPASRSPGRPTCPTRSWRRTAPTRTATRCAIR